jgi:hypothetical protein
MSADDMVQLVVAGRTQRALRVRHHVDLKVGDVCLCLRESGGAALRRQV